MQRTSSSPDRIPVLIDLRPSQGAPAGAGIYLRDLANALHEFYPVQGLISPRLGAVPDALVPLRAVTQSGPGFNLAALMLASRAGTHLISASRLPAVLRPRRGIPVFFDLVALLFPQTQTASSVAVKRAFDRRAAKARTVLSMSMTTSADLVRVLHARSDRIVTVRPGRPEPQPDDGNDATVLTEFGIKKPYVLSVGTLEPRKNLTLLLDVFRQASFTPALQLVLAGPRGWKMEPLEGRIEELRGRGVLVMPGYVSKEKRAALYRRALCLAFPSLYEGFGLPLLEAMSYGTPVLASTAPACVEVVDDAGILLSPNDPPAWSAAIQRLARNEGERARLSEAGRKRAGLFSWRESVRPLAHRLCPDA